MSTTGINDPSGYDNTLDRTAESPLSNPVKDDKVTQREVRLSPDVHVTTGKVPSSLPRLDPSSRSEPPKIGGKLKYGSIGGGIGATIAGAGVGVATAVKGGALIGGVVGSALGPVGTIVGAAVGGLLAGVVVGLAVRWARKPSEGQSVPPKLQSHSPVDSIGLNREVSRKQLRASKRQMVKETTLDHDLLSRDFDKLNERSSKLNAPVKSHDIVEEDESVGLETANSGNKRSTTLEPPLKIPDNDELEEIGSGLDPVDKRNDTNLVDEPKPEREPKPDKVDKPPVRNFVHSPEVNREIATLSSQQARNRRAQKLQREFGGLDTEVARRTYFNNPGRAFQLLGDFWLTDDRLAPPVRKQAKSVADHALGLKNVQGDTNAAAMGLEPQDVAVMRELATIAAVVEDRLKDPSSTPLHPRVKQSLKERVATIEAHLAGITRRDEDTDKLMREYTRDFALLSKSGTVKTLRESRAELTRIQSELRQLDDIGQREKAPKRAPKISKGQKAVEEIERARMRDQRSFFPIDGEAKRKQQMVETLNKHRLKTRFPTHQQRTKRKEQLQQRAEKLRRDIEIGQMKLRKESQPMIKKYGHLGFKPDPTFWEREGQDMFFPLQQTHTKQAIYYARRTLIPDLKRTLDLL